MTPRTYHLGGQVYTLAQKYLTEYPDWRAGQCAMNALRELDQMVFLDIVGTFCDPFHDDGRLIDFWIRLGQEG